MNYDLKQSTIQSDAAEIIAHARRLSAERIVFRTDDAHFFSDPKMKPISEVMVASNPPRYKLQKVREGKWVDVSKYCTVSHAADALTALKNGDVDTACRWRPEDIARAADQNESVFHNALRVILRSFATGPQEWRSKEKLRNIRLLFESIAEIRTDPYLDYALATTRLYQEVRTLSFKNFPDSVTVNALISRVENTIASETKIFASDSSLLAANMTLAKLHSLRDRNAAAHYFGKIRGQGNIDLVKYFFIDTGSLTYFPAEHVSDKSRRDAASVRESVSEVEVSAPMSESAVLISVDPHFFRIYSPIIFYYAQQLPEIDLNIILCGDEKDVRELARTASSYRNELSQLSGLEVSNNIHLFRMPIPSFVAEEKTFFASARFYAIDAMLQRYDQIYVMDADLLTDTDPRPFFNSVKNLSFSVPEMHTFQALSPWRRFMAGNMAVNRSALETKIVDELQTYLAYGSLFENSWMLDQNALAYTIERNRDDFEDLARYDRPFKQPKFRSVWEARYWKFSKHSPR